jgi:hypothetical protein
LQVLLTDASRVLHRALDGRVFFKDVTVVVPNSWRDEKCQTQILVPRGSTTYGVRQPCFERLKSEYDGFTISFKIAIRTGFVTGLVKHFKNGLKKNLKLFSHI